MRVVPLKLRLVSPTAFAACGCTETGDSGATGEGEPASGSQQQSSRHNILATAGLTLLVAACLLASGCRNEPPTERDSAPEVHQVLGTVRRFPTDGADFVLVTADSAAVAYRVDALPVPFRIDGLPVLFSGRLASNRHDPGRFGVPLVLTAIHRADSPAASY